MKLSEVTAADLRIPAAGARCGRSALRRTPSSPQRRSLEPAVRNGEVRE